MRVTMDGAVLEHHLAAARAAGFAPITPEILARISAAWSRETALDGDAWSQDHPERGQCAVTAALVHEELGIPMVRGQAFLPDGTIESYYWNEGLHLTAAQYPDGTTWRARDTGPQGQDAFDYVMQNADATRRYEILKARYKAATTLETKRNS